MATTHKTEILNYCKDIRTGKILAGEYTKKAVKRFESELKKSKEEGYPYFIDWDAVNNVIDFAECLRVPDINGALTLFPFQKWIYCNVWGWRYKDNPERRRFRTCFIEIARKNSKTTSLLFPFILYDCITTPAAESYFVSSSLDQANKSFVELSHIIDETPELKSAMHCYSKAITYNNSRITFFSADTTALDSYKNSFSVVDEFHNYDNDKVITAFRYGARARLNGTVCIITSAGNNTNSPCYNEVMKARNILDGSLSDDSYFTVLYEADKKDDWRNPDILIKANPALGTFLQKEVLISDLNDAIMTPSHQADYKSKTLGIWNTQGLSNWLDADVLLDEQVDFEAEFTGQPCFAGLDLSQTQDLTVYTLCFQREGKYYFKHRFYIPTEQIKKKSEKDSINYPQWIQEGLVTATDGATVDYEQLIQDFCNDAEKYNIIECSFDRWNSRLIINRLNDLLPNITFIDTDQSIKNFSEPTKLYERLALEHRLVDGNKVARYCLSNACIKPDTNGNYKPLKVYNGAHSRIDSVITSIMALDRCFNYSHNKPKTVSFEEVLNSF